jgi:hypothetical protein
MGLFDFFKKKKIVSPAIPMTREAVSAIVQNDTVIKETREIAPANTHADYECSHLSRTTYKIPQKNL